MTQNNKLISGVILFTSIFVILSMLRYLELAFMLPHGIHEHGLGDRLSVAIQFYDNGMNFFLPRTNHIYAIDGITPVEFPIHSYLAACLGYIFGRESITTSFRLLTLFITYLGLLSLYFTALRATKDILTSLFVPLFIFSSPTFAYYACSYLPDVASVSISFIGFYFYYSFLQKRTFKKLLSAIVFLTLATLIKTTVGIILLTVMGYEILGFLIEGKKANKKKVYKTLLLFSSSILPIIGYYIYNQYLLHKYNGCIFVMSMMPFQSWEEAKIFFTYSIPHVYLNEYYIILQYPILLVLFVIGIINIYKNRNTRFFLIFITTMFLGAISATLLFGQQMIYHDYYFISIWQPVLTISMLVFIIETRKRIHDKKMQSLYQIASTITIFIIVLFAHKDISSRIAVDEARYPGLKETLPSNWMKGGDKILDSLGIGRDSVIMVLDENPTNVGLVYFDRKGLNAPVNASSSNIANVRAYMIERDIWIMVCDARKMPRIKSTNEQSFSNIFEELYIDEYCAVYSRIH